MERKSRWTKIPFYIVLLCMLAALTLYAYLGTFTRYMADDYCSAAALKSEGFWGTQSYWWRNWSGRYSFTFAISLLELLGLKVVPVLPALIILLWLVSVIWGCLPLFKNLKVSNSIAGLLFLASVALWLTYRSVNDYPQVVFWQTGILTYPVSPILFFMGLGIALRRASGSAGVKWWEVFLWFLFAFLAGGFSETGVVIQIALLAVLLIFLLLTKSEDKRVFIPILLIALFGSILSLVLIALAPGNSARSAGFQNIPSLLPSLWGSLKETLVFIPGLADRHTIVFVFALLAGAVFAYFFTPEDIQPDRSSILKYSGASLVFVLVGSWAGIAPAYLLRGGVPPQRVLLFPYFLAACLVLLWGALAALLLRSILPKASLGAQRWVSLVLLIVFMILGVLPFAASQLKLVTPLKTYSSMWDERHQTLLLASQQKGPVIVTTDLTKVKELGELRARLWLSGDFETNPENWINRCAAQYYGVDQILVK